MYCEDCFLYDGEKCYYDNDNPRQINLNPDGKYIPDWCQLPDVGLTND